MKATSHSTYAIYHRILISNATCWRADLPINHNSLHSVQYMLSSFTLGVALPALLLGMQWNPRRGISSRNRCTLDLFHNCISIRSHLLFTFRCANVLKRNARNRPHSMLRHPSSRRARGCHHLPDGVQILRILRCGACLVILQVLLQLDKPSHFIGFAMLSRTSHDSTLHC